MAVLAVLAGSAIWGIAESLGYKSTMQKQSAYVSPTQGIALTGEVENNTLNIDVKPQEELEKLTDASGKPYAQAGSLELPADATEVSVNFMRQFKNVASQITTINFGENIYSLGDAYFNEEEQRYIGVFDGFIALQSVNMPNVETIGSYAFYGCMALETVSVNVDSLVVGNLAIKNTSETLKIGDVSKLTFTGDWGAAAGNGIEQQDIEKFSYEFIRYFATEGNAKLKANALASCEQLRVLDLLQNTLEQTEDFLGTGCPQLEQILITLDGTNIASQVLMPHLKKIYVASDIPNGELDIFPQEAPDPENMYFTHYAEMPYILQSLENESEHYIQYLYIMRFMPITSNGQTYIEFYSPSFVNSALKSLNITFEDNFSTLYIPSSVGSLHIDVLTNAAHAQNGYQDMKLSYELKGVKEIVVSGGITKVENWITPELNSIFNSIGTNKDIIAKVLVASYNDDVYAPDLQSLRFCDGIQTISYAFLDINNTTLQDVHLPSTLQTFEIGLSPVFEHVYISDNGTFSTDEDNTALLQTMNGVTGIVSGNKFAQFPTSATVVGQGAFMGLKQTSLTIPGHIEMVGPGAFAASHMETITIENGVKELYDSCFSAC